MRDGVYEHARGSGEHAVACRFITVTTDDLESKARAAEFRSKLYCALLSFAITLPALRQRHGDLPLLVDHRLRKLTPIARSFGVDRPRVSEPVMRALSTHVWSVESVVPAGEQQTSSRYSTDWSRFAELRIEAGSDTLHAEAIAETEKKLFSRVLRHTGGNQARPSGSWASHGRACGRSPACTGWRPGPSMTDARCDVSEPPPTTDRPNGERAADGRPANRGVDSPRSASRRLTVLYIFALSTVTLLSIGAQALIQRQLSNGGSDARVINVAGRQRTLSQRLAKPALRLAGAKGDRLGQPGGNSDAVTGLFALIVTDFERMRAAARSFVEQPSAADPDAIETIQRHEGPLLAGMADRLEEACLAGDREAAAGLGESVLRMLEGFIDRM